MTKFLLFLLIPCYALSASDELHEYHISITEITLNSDSQRLEISMQLFVDDFEKALHIAKRKTKIKDDLNDQKVWQAIQDYLKEHFSLDVNGSKLKLTYLGAQWDDDLHAFFVFIEADVKQEITELSIYNSVFTEVDENQQNMHHLTLGTYNKSVLLVKDKEHSSVKIIQ